MATGYLNRPGVKENLEAIFADPATAAEHFADNQKREIWLNLDLSDADRVAKLMAVDSLRKQRFGDALISPAELAAEEQKIRNSMSYQQISTYLAGGDTALSVGMTSINALLAPFLTPALTYLYLRTTVSVDVKSMFLSIIQVVLVPIGLGLLINKFFGKYTQKITDLLPTVSVTAICLIVAAVVSHNSAKILSTGLVIFAVVILHNLLGYLCGYLVAVLFKMDLPRKKAVAIEIGMQNSGLATSLAGSAFPNMAMATVPGAIFSVWHNISGAILAGVLKNR